MYRDSYLANKQNAVAISLTQIVMILAIITSTLIAPAIWWETARNHNANPYSISAISSSRTASNSGRVAGASTLANAIDLNVAGSRVNLSANQLFLAGGALIVISGGAILYIAVQRKPKQKINFAFDNSLPF